MIWMKTLLPAGVAGRRDRAVVDRRARQGGWQVYEPAPWREATASTRAELGAKF